MIDGFLQPLAAFDEAVRRIRPQYKGVLRARGDAARLTFHLTLEVEIPEVER